ncbi:SLBB domain-containing protein [Salicola sp. Rm-C-2C1-2]|uniref:SLBB domain-containing protein n=1 Tax=Salicola sp. Rm-C-2C1-2 TaxID=3141321 RepID=UPI0032E43159
MPTNRLITALLLLLLPLTGSAQNLSQSQVDRFMSLPQSQQEQLAQQYGVDIDQLRQRNSGGDSSLEKPDAPVVQPTKSKNGNGDAESENDKANEKARKADKSDALNAFGYDLFKGEPSTFAPVTEVPVPTGYIIGTGDTIQLQLYGKKTGQYNLTVGRDGTIAIPEIGPFSVAGLSFNELRNEIQKMVTDRFIGVESSVRLGELRSMRVFVLGEARNPGAYTVSSLSTLTNALFVSGGIQKTGSLRRIQHKRDGEVIGTFDLYDLLLEGDSSDDARLQAGDVIFIPPVGKRVSVGGEVRRPARYELRGETTLESVIALAGGMTEQAYPKRVRIERINDDFLRMLGEVDASQPKGMNAPVQAGDHIRIPSIADVTGQYVELKGAVTRSGRFAWMPGMRLSSLIANLGTDLDEAADHTAALLIRRDPETDLIAAHFINPRAVVENPGSDADPELQEKDRILFFADLAKADLPAAAYEEAETNGEDRTLVQRMDQLASNNELSDEQAKRWNELKQWRREQMMGNVIQRLRKESTPNQPAPVAAISGEVRYPGSYPITQERSLSNLLKLAGGLKDGASLEEAEVSRLKRDDQGDGSRVIRTLDVTPLANDRTIDDFHLQSRDRVQIKSIPAFNENRTVTLGGEIRFPGTYSLRKGESLEEVVERAGGLTQYAFPEGAVFTRESLKERERKRLREAEEKLQGRLLGQQIQGEDFTNQKQGQQQTRELLDRISEARAVGRMVIDLKRALRDPDYQSIRLQDGDSLTVPEQPQSVSVLGEVQFPTSHLHDQGLTLNDYIERSGGPNSQADEDRVYIIRANGSVSLPNRSNWFASNRTQLSPGDTVVMPLDVDQLSQLQLWTDVSQIIYQMSLGAAAIDGL